MTLMQSGKDPLMNYLKGGNHRTQDDCMLDICGFPVMVCAAPERISAESHLLEEV